MGKLPYSALRPITCQFGVDSVFMFTKNNDGIPKRNMNAYRAREWFQGGEKYF
jgi:hypothetical protein